MTYQLLFSILLLLVVTSSSAQFAAYHVECDSWEYNDLRDKCTQDKLYEFIYQYLGEKDAFSSGDTLIEVKIDLVVDVIGNLSLIELQMLYGTEMQTTLIRTAIDDYAYDNTLIPAENADGEMVTDKQNYTFTFIGYPNEEVGKSWYRERFKVVEKMPVFPGCQDVAGDHRTRKRCGDKKMFAFIKENLEYPDEAREAGFGGTAVIQCLVDLDGSLKHLRIVRDPGGGLGEEAAYVIYLMSQMEEKWLPGVQRTHPRRIQYNLPVRFY